MYACKILVVEQERILMIEAIECDVNNNF
jgi:hypothetical protein